MAWSWATVSSPGEHTVQPLTRHCRFAQQQQRREWRRAVPVSPWVFVVPTICGTLIFLAALVVLWKVYKRGGAKDAREFARALGDLRPSSLIADICSGVAP